MPVLSSHGSMTIVAHQDDDILFMNPDIAHSIAAGEANTTVFVTAGDAGLGASYWQGREAGAKAAYSAMTGVDDWVDEVVRFSDGVSDHAVASSYLASAPDIRLYFLRLPDGGGALAPGSEQQLARLESGALSHVTTVDGAASYSRADLVSALTGLMDLHSPSGFRLQLHEGETAAAEHTDHIHTAEFAEEALAAYSGGMVEVVHYVNYDSRLMPANLDAQDAALSLRVMQAYAQHDPAVLTADATLAPIYQTWTGRQYVAERFMLDTDADAPVAPEVPDLEPWPGEGDWTYALEGPDAVLFQISASDGAVTPKDWFTPSLDDAWDADGDHRYDLTRIARSLTGDDETRQDLVLETVAEGTLVLVSARDDAGGDPDGTGASGTTDDMPPDDGTPAPGDGGAAAAGPGDQAPAEQEQGGEAGAGQSGSDPVAADYPAGTLFSLSGEDAFLFSIDPASGEITPQGWFTPSADDAWDRNEDHIYELTRTAQPPDGAGPVVETLRLQTVADGVLSPIAGDDVEDESDAAADAGDATQAAAEAEAGDTASGGSGADDSAGAGGDPGDTGAGDAPGAAGSGTVFSLSGPDAHLFVIDVQTGEIALQQWFAPDPGDAWDRNEDHVYELVRTQQPVDGPASHQDLRYEIEDGSNPILLPDPEADPDPVELMVGLMMSPEPGNAAEVFVQQEEELETEVMDAAF